MEHCAAIVITLLGAELSPLEASVFAASTASGLEVSTAAALEVTTAAALGASAATSCPFCAVVSDIVSEISHCL